MVKMVKHSRMMSDGHQNVCSSFRLKFFENFYSGIKIQLEQKPNVQKR